MEGVDGHLSYHTDKCKGKRFPLLLLIVYGAEEAQGGWVENFLLDETEEDNPRPWHKSYWSAEAATPGAGKALQPLVMGIAAAFDGFGVGFSMHPVTQVELQRA